MRIAATALVALAVSPAAADTAVSVGGARCEVRFVRAPDDVRHEIERWLAAEPRCVGAIDLRVLPIEGGYYLLAQRPDGRLHERVAPDAQSAGVLVASWVADDWVEPPAPPPPPVAPRPLIVNPFAADLGIAKRAPAPPVWSPRSLTVTAMIHAGEEGGGGLRADIDLLARGRWTAGLALSVSTAGYAYNEVTSYATEDYKATVQVARSSTFGPWQLRFAVGAGVISTTSHLTSYVYTGSDSAGMYDTVETGSPVAEASVHVSRKIGRDWALTAGAVMTVMSQELLFLDPYSWESKMVVAGRDHELMFTGGLRYSL